jgi:ATP-dependent DNA ligase
VPAQIRRGAAYRSRLDYGFRILARRNGDSMWLYTRNGYNFADCFPRIVEAIRCARDGEAIVFDQRGLSAFDLLRFWRHYHACSAPSI